MPCSRGGGWTDSPPGDPLSTQALVCSHRDTLDLVLCAGSMNFACCQQPTSWPIGDSVSGSPLEYTGKFYMAPGYFSSAIIAAIFTIRVSEQAERHRS